MIHHPVRFLAYPPRQIRPRAPGYLDNHGDDRIPVAPGARPDWQLSGGVTRWWYKPSILLCKSYCHIFLTWRSAPFLLHMGPQYQYPDHVHWPHLLYPVPADISHHQ